MNNQNQTTMKNYYARRWIFFPFIGIAALFLFSLLVMLLWNAILPVIFKIGMITIWQALGILVLSKILFGGIHGGFRGRPHHMGSWKHRWMNMSEEERTRMREEWSKRCRPSSQA